MKSLHAILVKICTDGEITYSCVATAEVQHPLPHCAYVHCIISMNIQESLNVSRDNFSLMEEFSGTHLFHTHFHVRYHRIRLTLSGYWLCGNKI